MKPGARAGNQERWWIRERIWAWVFAIVLHVLVFYGLTRPAPMPDVEDTAMDLVVLIPPLTPASTRKPDLAQTSPRLHPGARPESADDAVTSEASDDALRVQVIGVPTAMPALLVHGDDDWDMPAHGTADDHDFKPHPLRTVSNSFETARPERFRMRKQLSPRDIVRGVSQLLGFWPPGYTDDPCGGIRRSVEMLSMSLDSVPRWQLEQAIEAEQTYCP